MRRVAVTLALAWLVASAAGAQRSLPADASATIGPEAARDASAATVAIDPRRFGQPEERKRLLARWQREMGNNTK